MLPLHGSLGHRPLEAGQDRGRPVMKPAGDSLQLRQVFGVRAIRSHAPSSLRAAVVVGARYQPEEISEPAKPDR